MILLTNMKVSKLWNRISLESLLRSYSFTELCCTFHFSYIYDSCLSTDVVLNHYNNTLKVAPINLNIEILEMA